MGIWRSSAMMRIGLLLASAFGCLAKPPAAAFKAPVGYPIHGNVYQVAVTDLNGDGHPDLVAVLGPNNETAHYQVAVLLGKGGDRFQEAAYYGVGTGARSIAVGDFNGDGKPDVVVGETAGVTILLGKGDGAFQRAVTYPLQYYPGGLATGDFNGDGKLDLVVDSSAATVSILLGNGDGTFQAPVAYPAGHDPQLPAVADLNGDGILDVAVSGQNTGQIAVLFGNGDGTFQAPIFVTLEPLTGVGDVVVADFNSDGILDLGLLWAGNGYGECMFSVMLGNGYGTFQPPLISHTHSACGGLPPETGDFNGDGIVNLAVQGGEVLLGNGDGTFHEKSDPGGGYLGSLVAADFNGDGILDLAAIGGETVVILMGNGDGSFQQPAHYDVAATTLAVGDFTGDGKPNVAAGFCGDSAGPNAYITIVLNGSPTQQKVTAPYCWLLTVGDFNGDGKLDLAVVNTTNTVSIFLGNGDGTFQAPTSYATGTTPDAIAVADFNGDGKLDLATSNYGSSNVSVLLGNGDGSFQPQVSYAVGTNPIWIAAADFNKDGKMDLVTANVGTSSTSVLLGNGDGTFLPQVTTAAPKYPVFVAAGDFNGDGYPDLAISYGAYQAPQTRGGSALLAYPNVVGILLGNGDGTFRPQGEYAAGPEPQSIAIADFDGDGNLDLAVGQYQGSTVSLFLGNGDGTFDPNPVESFVSRGSFPRVLAADVNGDGKPDIVTGALVTVLINTTP